MHDFRPHDPRSSGDNNDPLKGLDRFSAISLIRATFAHHSHEIKDENLRTLLDETIELCRDNPELLRHDSDIRALAQTVTLLTRGVSEPPSESANAAGILSAIFKGAASAIENQELTVEDALSRINRLPATTNDSSEHPEATGFDFAVQYGSANFTPRELFQAFSAPNRDLLAEQFDDSEIILIALFKSGYAQLSLGNS